MQKATQHEPTDEQLAEQARFDPEAFGRLYRRYFDKVYGYLRYRVNQRSTADDLAATVFMRALDRLGSYDPARGPFGPWLLTIARNHLNDHYRSRARWRWLPLGVVKNRFREGGPDTEFESRERRDEVLAAMARLGKRERDVLGLKFATGHSNRDIAALTGLSESNVGVIIHRALGRLRKDLCPKEADHV